MGATCCHRANVCCGAVCRSSGSGLTVRKSAGHEGASSLMMRSDASSSSDLRAVRPQSVIGRGAKGEGSAPTGIESVSWKGPSNLIGTNRPESSPVRNAIWTLLKAHRDHQVRNNGVTGSSPVEGLALATRQHRKLVSEAPNRSPKNSDRSLAVCGRRGCDRVRTGCLLHGMSDQRSLSDG